MRTWLAIALVVGACGKRTADPGAACNDAAAKGVDAMVRLAKQRLAAAQLPADVRATMEERTVQLGEVAPRLKAVVARRCVEDKWPREVIDCYAGGGAPRSIDEMRACRSKLPAEASSRLMKDELDLMAGAMTPPSMAPGMAAVPQGDPAQVAAANELAAQMRQVGAQINETLKQIDAAANDAERAAARAQLEVLKKQADEIRSKLTAAQTQVTAPIAPQVSAQQQAALDAVQKEIDAAVKEIEGAKNGAERDKARAHLKELQEKLRAIKRAPAP